MQISFKSEIRSLTAELQKVKASAIPKATAQALNRTATGVKTDAKRIISKETNEKQKVVADAIKISRKATEKIQQAELNASKGFAKNLIHFVTPGKRKVGYWNQSRKLKSGKRKYKFKGVRAKAWGKSKIYDGSFIGTGKYGLTVYARIGKDRGKLKKLSGPSIRMEFERKATQEKLHQHAKERFIKNMSYTVRNQIRIAQGG